MELYLHFPYVFMEWCLIEHSDTFAFYPKCFQPGSLRPAMNMNEHFFFSLVKVLKDLNYPF